MMDFVEEIESYSPQTHPEKTQSNPGLQLEPQPFQSNPYEVPDYQEQKTIESNSSYGKEDKEDKEEPTGCTKFCKQKYYEEYFKVN